MGEEGHQVGEDAGAEGYDQCCLLSVNISDATIDWTTEQLEDREDCLKVTKNDRIRSEMLGEVGQCACQPIRGEYYLCQPI